AWKREGDVAGRKRGSKRGREQEKHGGAFWSCARRDAWRAGSGACRRGRSTTPPRYRPGDIPRQGTALAAGELHRSAGDCAGQKTADANGKDHERGGTCAGGFGDGSGGRA